MMMKSTRDRILHTLLNHPRSTINELAETVGINSISVRHHLNSMLAEGLVSSEEERHGVGRPRLVYFLTETGVEKFPTRYYRFTNRLLDQVKEALPADTVERLFSNMAKELAEKHAPDAENLPLDARLVLLKNLLAQEGFAVEWEIDSDEIRINEITCPYFHVGQSHPEVCSVDQTLISTILAIPAHKINCILNGDHHCTYVIPIRQTAENQT
jgi:predicted ArsR family transcriptional regulator